MEWPELGHWTCPDCVLAASTDSLWIEICQQPVNRVDGVQEAAGAS